MNEDLVTLVSPQTEFEANILAIVLKDHGINAFVFANPGMTFGVSFSSGTLGYPLQVPRNEVERARQVLIGNKRHSIDIDWDELELAGSGESPFEQKPMPITARIAFFCVVLALISGICVVVLQLLN